MTLLGLFLGNGKAPGEMCSMFYIITYQFFHYISPVCYIVLSPEDCSSSHSVSFYTCVVPNFKGFNSVHCLQFSFLLNRKINFEYFL